MLGVIVRDIKMGFSSSTYGVRSTAHVMWLVEDQRLFGDRVDQFDVVAHFPSGIK
jgi:hypothetical protein